MFNARKPFGEVHGTGVAGARFYQDGQYYDVDYRYVFSDPGIDAPRGQARKSMEEAEAEMRRREEARSRGQVVTESTGNQAATAPVAPVAPASPAPVVPPVPQPPPADTGDQPLTKEQQLMQLNVPRLQEMQLKVLKQQNDEQPDEKRKQEKELRADVIKGPGAKERLIEWLVKATA